MDKRAIIFLTVGVICAGVVVVVAAQFLQGSGKKEKVPEHVKVLVASKNVEYGNALQQSKDGKEGNIAFMRWPQSFVPEGAVTDAKELKDKEFVAVDTFTRYEPILKSQMIEKENFIPDDMLPRRISVDPKDVKVGLLKSGMRVDIYRNYQEFMQCARICAIGELKYNQPAEEQKKESANYAYVLIKRSQMVEFEKASDSGNLKVFPSNDTCSGGPMLASEVAGSNGNAAAELLQKGSRQVAQGQFGEAVKTFETVTEEYPDVAPAVEKANQWLTTCHRLLAEGTFLEAQEAFIKADYAGCTKLLESVLENHANATQTVQKAEELKKTAEHKAQQKRYEVLLSELQKNLQSGNLPKVEELLKEQLQKEFVETEFKADKSTPPPAEALRRYQADLRSRQRVFDNLIRVFEALRQSGNVRRAQEKFHELARRFPKHPYVNNQSSQNKANN
mgnify:CR=1 FL=1